MIIDVYTFCWNEEIRLPYFLRLWGPIARRIIIYDNGSTDKSREIALKYPNVVWDTVTYGQNEINDTKLCYIKNNCWKQNRDADLCFVGDMDEFTYHPQGIVNFTREALDAGFTVFKPLICDMISKEEPSHPGMIWDNENYKYGIKIIDKKNLNKVNLFSPKSIEDMNYGCGAHQASPKGKVKIFYHEDFKMLHYKMIGKNFLTRLKDSGKRLSETNIRNGHGVHYNFPVKKHVEYFNNANSNKEKLI